MEQIQQIRLNYKRIKKFIECLPLLVEYTKKIWQTIKQVMSDEVTTQIEMTSEELGGYNV